MRKPKEWEICGGTIEKRRLVLFEKTEVSRTTKVEVYDPDVCTDIGLDVIWEEVMK